MLSDFNKDLDYKVSLENFCVNDDSENNTEAYSYNVNIVYTKDDIKKIFEVDGWVEYGYESIGECNYDEDEISKYIEDYEDILEYIQGDLAEYEQLF